MSETVFVDLSAKVEQWSKDTAVAFSDGIRGSPADILARRTYEGKGNVEREVSLNDIKRLFG